MPYGTPLTEEERKAEHERLYGGSPPPQRYGYGNPGNPGTESAQEVEKRLLGIENGMQKLLQGTLQQKAAYVADIETIRSLRWIPFNWHAQKLEGNDTTQQDLELKNLRPGYIYVITAMSGSDSNIPATIRLGVTNGAEVFIYNSDVPSAANISIDWGGQITLQHGSWPIAQFFSVDAAGDDLHFYVSGYYLKQ